MRLSSSCCCVGHKFYIPLALPISPEIMDGFWCSRCLNDCIEVPTWWDYLQVAPQPPWWWKFELNNPGWKLSIRATLITILRYLEAKFDYGNIIFFCNGFKILHKKSQVILSKNEGMTAIFPNFDFILNRENQCHGFIYAWYDLKIFV